MYSVVVPCGPACRFSAGYCSSASKRQIGETTLQDSGGLSTWNGTFDIHRPPLPNKETVFAITDAKGVAVFHLPQPIPKHAGFEIGGLRDFAGCWRLPDLSLETVMRSGVVADYNESKCGKLRTQVSAKPGEVVIVDKKLTLGDQMRQEIP